MKRFFHKNIFMKYKCHILDIAIIDAVGEGAHYSF